MSFIFRASGHVGIKFQECLAKILKTHYVAETNNSWDFHFTHKSTTITDIHFVLEQKNENKKLSPIEEKAIHHIFDALNEIQIARKQLVSLYQERIPQSQWIILYILCFILLITLSIIPSHLLILQSIIKSSFVCTIFFIMFLLHYLYNLHFFERTIGEHSATDVLDIIEGKK